MARIMKSLLTGSEKERALGLLLLDAAHKVEEYYRGLSPAAQAAFVLSPAGVQRALGTWEYDGAQVQSCDTEGTGAGGACPATPTATVLSLIHI
jgi:hypothetical protein